MNILSYAESRGIPYRVDLALSSVCSIGTGGTAQIALYPTGGAQLIDVLRVLRRCDRPHRILGRMTNTLPSDGICSEVLIFTDRIRQMTVTDAHITLGAGCLLSQTARHFADRGIALLHRVATIPGSIGGAIRANSGAFEHTIGEEVAFATLYDPTLDRVLCLDAAAMRFGYRHSILKEEPFILLSSTFPLRRASPSVLHDEMAAHRALRRMRQPTQPSLGSIFLRVQGVSAGYYIDRAGLRGARVGGVSVSCKHAGFIVRDGEARSADVLLLMDRIRQTVWERFGITLVPEIEIL